MRRLYPAAAAAALVLVNVACFAFLRDWISTPPPDTGVTFDGGSRASTTGDDPLAGPVLLAGSPDGAVLRATHGSCTGTDDDPADDPAAAATTWVAAPGSGPVEVSVDGLGEALAVGRDQAGWWIIGTAGTCDDIVAWSGSLAGDTWKQTDLPADAWYLDPGSTGNKVVSPRGAVTVASDCSVETVQAVGDRVYASCSAPIAYEADRVEREFTTVASLEPVVTLAGRADGQQAIMTTSDKCLAGVQVKAANGRITGEHCFGSEQAPLGIAWIGDDLVAQTGFDLVTNESGEWEPRA